MKVKNMFNTKKSGLLSAMAFAVLLAGCTSGTKAPVSDLYGDSSSAAASTASAASGVYAATAATGSGGSYVVKPGDTLYRIAKNHGMDVNSLMRMNNISSPSQLAVGQTLVLSGSAPSSASMPAAPGTGVKPTTALASSVPAAPAAVSVAGAPRASDAQVLSWMWPVKGGSVIQGFSDASRGIDISGTVGQTVMAAAGGKVSYVGNGLRGLGNLVLITHSNGFISAYAHNSKLLVKDGQQVSAGQKIAELGQSDASSPRLHFEIRRFGKPVNPASYLPRR